LFVSQSKARKTRSRNGAVLAGSLLLHAVVLAALGWPVERRFLDRSNDEDAISVTLERSAVPHRPTEVRAASPDQASAASPLRPRAPRLAPPSSVTPLGVAPVPAPGPPTTRPPTAIHPAPLPEGPRGDLRTALRGSSVGCANAQAVGLNRREQERCDERLGAMARNAPVYDAPMDAAKRRGFEAQALKQQADRAYRDAPTVGVDHRNRDNPGKGKDIPWVLGAEQDGLGRSLSTEQQALRRLDDARKADERRKKAARQNDQR
jgi:hypothetical protein